MAVERLPRVRELSGLTSTMVMLRCVGALLRAEYGDLLQEPVPEHLTTLAHQLR